MDDDKERSNRLIIHGVNSNSNILEVFLSLGCDRFNGLEARGSRCHEMSKVTH